MLIPMQPQKRAWKRRSEEGVYERRGRAASQWISHSRPGLSAGGCARGEITGLLPRRSLHRHTATERELLAAGRLADSPRLGSHLSAPMFRGLNLTHMAQEYRVKKWGRGRWILAELQPIWSEQWYTSTMNLLGTWLTDRMDLQLHLYQLKILIRIVKKKYRDFRLQGVLDSTLNSKMYDTVRNRLTLEEATASVREGGMQGVSMKDSDEEDNGN
ncbi:hypothetical protein NQZ68_021797 [Dissostichus eleginoides]|nr:hypothetical protein NQZ68_021797 [Dissostichus eleginoides]